MKKNIFLLCISAVVAFGVISCKKDKSEEPKGLDFHCKISQINVEGKKRSIFEYNSSGNLIKSINYDTLGLETSMQERTYPIGQEIVSTYYDGNLTNQEIYTLGTNGYAEKKIYLPTNSSFYNDTTYYDYNTNGYLTKTTVLASGYSNTTSYTYSNGNLIESVRINKSDVSSDTIISKYEYYLDKQNKFSYSSSRNITGRPNTNLTKHSESITSSGKSWFDYIYIVDSKGDVTSLTAKTGTLTYAVNYIYKCD